MMTACFSSLVLPQLATYRRLAVHAIPRGLIQCVLLSCGRVAMYTYMYIACSAAFARAKGTYTSARGIVRG